MATVGAITEVAFDPFSPFLFLATDTKLWRASATPGAAPVLFASDLARPGGVSFPRSGVLLVSEEDTNTLTAIDGWRHPFLRGDVDGTSGIQLNDATLITNYLFQGGAEPACLDSADINDDSRLDITDSVVLLNFRFQGGPPPHAPHPAPGADPTPDLLGCRSYTTPRI